MRLYVNGQWYDPTEANHVVVELSSKDKQNICNMTPETDLYAVFSERETVENARAILNAINDARKSEMEPDT